MNNENTIKKIKSIAKKIYLEFDDDENDFFLQEFHIFLKQLKIFSDDKDIDNFNPVSFPFEIKKIFYLRDDIVKNIEKMEDILKNANNKLAGQIKISKVMSDKDE